MNHRNNDSDFYSDRKHCEPCNKYVSYLMSIDKSFCVECGGEVRLFSKDDWMDFNEKLSERRPKGGRPRKARNGEKKESA